MRKQEVPQGYKDGLTATNEQTTHHIGTMNIHDKT